MGSSAAAENAKVVYEQQCAFCHGIEGRGDGPAGSALRPPPTNFTSPSYWKTATLESVKASIINGKPGSAMVAFGKTLKPEDIDALAQYLRHFAP